MTYSTRIPGYAPLTDGEIAAICAHGSAVVYKPVPGCTETGLFIPVTDAEALGLLSHGKIDVAEHGEGVAARGSAGGFPFQVFGTGDAEVRAGVVRYLESLRNGHGRFPAASGSGSEAGASVYPAHAGADRLTA
jgi:hypothetical protein